MISPYSPFLIVPCISLHFFTFANKTATDVLQPQRLLYSQDQLDLNLPKLHSVKSLSPLKYTRSRFSHSVQYNGIY